MFHRLQRNSSLLNTTFEKEDEEEVIAVPPTPFQDEAAALPEDYNPQSVEAFHTPDEDQTDATPLAQPLTGSKMDQVLETIAALIKVQEVCLKIYYNLNGTLLIFFTLCSLFLRPTLKSGYARQRLLSRLSAQAPCTGTSKRAWKRDVETLWKHWTSTMRALTTKPRYYTFLLIQLMHV